MENQAVDAQSAAAVQFVGDGNDGLAADFLLAGQVYQIGGVGDDGPDAVLAAKVAEELDAFVGQGRRNPLPLVSDEQYIRGANRWWDKAVRKDAP